VICVFFQVLSGFPLVISGTLVAVPDTNQHMGFNFGNLTIPSMPQEFGNPGLKGG
jgi:hypothetical protein